MSTTSLSISSVAKHTQSQTSGSLNAHSLSSGVVHEVIGYSPTDFSTLATTGATNIQSIRGVASGTADLRLPPGALMISGQIVADPTTITSAGAPTFVIGTAATDTIAAGGAQLFAALTPAIIAAGGIVLNQAATNVILNTGQIVAATVAAGAANNFVTIGEQGNNNVTAGNFKIAIQYMVL